MILTLSIAFLAVATTSTTIADPLYQHLDQHSQAIIRAIRTLSTSSSSSSESQANFDLYNNSSSSPCQTRAQLITPKNGVEQLFASSTTEYRRQFVVNMTREAWNAYARHAWGQHHLQPLSLGQLEGWKAYSGQTLVGALSTLWLMDLKEEFALGRRWVEKEMIVDDRCLPKLGALLSAYALTGDGLFKAKAKEIADLYTPAGKHTDDDDLWVVVPFSSPFASLSSIYLHYYSQADLSPEKGDVPLQQKLVLEEWMQQRLEYPYLSNITGDPRYLKRVRRMDRFFGSAGKVSTQNKMLDESDKSNWSVKVKAYIQSKGKDAADLEQFYQLIEALEIGGHLRPSRSGLVYIRDDQSLPISNLMSSRYCHFGATLALGQLHRLTTPIGLAWQKYSAELQQTVRHLDLAKKVVELCHLAATSTETGLPPLKFFVDESRGSLSGVLTGGAQQTLNLESSLSSSSSPEVFCWSEGLENSCQRSASSSRSFDLGPQLAESYFVLWRLTGDHRYREYAWSLAKAIYKHARTVNGYAEVRDVLSMPAAKEDYQPPQFLSATLKYLYLIFSADDGRDQLMPLNLDSWVFTPGGQPLPVCESSVCFENGSPSSSN